MACNKLKLNRDKTEFLVIHTKHRPRPPICDNKIAGVRVVLTESARNIGVMFNDVMNHEHQVQNTCKVAFFHIPNLSKIRKCLTQEDTQTLVHAFVTSKLDNCNSLLAELAKYLLIRFSGYKMLRCASFPVLANMTELRQSLKSFTGYP